MHASLAVAEQCIANGKKRLRLQFTCAACRVCKVQHIRLCRVLKWFLCFWAVFAAGLFGCGRLKTTLEATSAIVQPALAAKA